MHYSYQMFQVYLEHFIHYSSLWQIFCIVSISYSDALIIVAKSIKQRELGCYNYVCATRTLQ